MTRRVVTLIKRLLKAKVVLPDGMRVSTEEGTPQGGPLSPLLSNVVLDELDWELERHGLCFVRYADDCNIYVGSEHACQRVMDSVRRFLEGRLRLLVNEDKSAVARPEERHFLGFRLRRNPDGQVEVHLSQRTVERLKLRIGELTPRSWGQSLKTCFEGLNEYLRGWFAYFRICTQTGADLFRVFDAHIRRALLHGPEQIADLPVPVAESPGAVRIGHPERSHLVEYLAPNSVFNSLPRQRSSPHLRPDDRLVTIDRVLHHASLGVA